MSVPRINEVFFLIECPLGVISSTIMLRRHQLHNSFHLSGRLPELMKLQSICPTNLSFKVSCQIVAFTSPSKLKVCQQHTDNRSTRIDSVPAAGYSQTCPHKTPCADSLLPKPKHLERNL